MSSLFLSLRPRLAGAPPLLLGLALLLASCDGSNLFTEPVGSQTGADASAPTVEFEYPQPDTVVTIAPLDSVLTRFRVRDNRGVAKVEISGFALRGDPALGNQTAVPRFVAKTVSLDSLGRMPRDTTLTRFLVSTRDSLPESRVYVVATARDSSGNVGADTVLVAIGGPRVQVVAPAADSAIRAGTSLSVRVSAEDRVDLIGSIRIRTTGAFQRDTTLTLRTPERQVDTTIVLAVPANAQGALDILATATSGRRIQGEGRPVRVVILAAAPDAVPPRVSFTSVIPSRLEVSDSLTVTVTATDETRVDSLGATVVAIRRTAARDDTLGVLTGKAAVSPPTNTRTLRLSLDPLGLSGLDTMTVSFEVVAFAKDGAGNCAAATAPGVPQSLPCRAGPRGSTVTQGAGALTVASLVRGRTVVPPGAGDTLVDLVSDRRRVYASNRSRNRIEVLPVGALAYSGSVLVGSQPWGLAMSPDSSTLLVANSGGAGSISLVPISAAGVGAEDRGRRIVTDNVVVYVVKFDIDESGRVDLTITDRDYSDRPQFLAQTASGRIVYSTVPTRSAPDGTVQEYTNQGAASSTDIFVEYARGFIPGQFVVRRADNVTKYIRGSGDNATDQLVICDHAPGQPTGSMCFPGASEAMTFQQIQEALRANGSDALIDYAVDPELIGLSDTTFLAVSKDHKTIAVGEGERSVGRVLGFAENASGAVTTIGNTRDLVNNASDRVIGLALNRDGSTGVARGQATYFFRRDLRQLGNRVVSGTPTGGVTLHPDHPNTSLAFISGQDEAGRPFVDVVDTFHFQVVRRLYIRNPVIGSMTAVSTGSAIRSGGAPVRHHGVRDRRHRPDRGRPPVGTAGKTAGRRLSGRGGPDPAHRGPGACRAPGVLLSA